MQYKQIGKNITNFYKYLQNKHFSKIKNKTKKVVK
jgi:hypothetical protein